MSGGRSIDRHWQRAVLPHPPVAHRSLPCLRRCCCCRKELLKTGGIEVEAYDLGGGSNDGDDFAVHDHHKPRSKDGGERAHNHDEDDRRLLVTLHEGWRGYQLKSFFMTQADIVHQVSGGHDPSGHRESMCESSGCECAA